MRPKLVVLIIFSVVLILLNQTPLLSICRQKLEEYIVLPLRQSTQGTIPESQSLKMLSLTEEVRELKAENRVLRSQLGAIPEKANLMPAQVVWQSENQYIVRFNYLEDANLVGHPVIWGEVYLGRISRVGAQLLVVDKPISSGFVARAITGTGQEGRVKGQYNQQIIFEIEIGHNLDIGDRIYYQDPEKGWRFFLGPVTELKQNKRLPIKQGIINYLSNNSKLDTVFVVL